ncbi:MAG: hypothetical protein M1608_07070, partial [Candidatus Omnitrophica bacterium]|nr:hypothetical protein [Candidatus Omnitrophota bacterium]
MNFPEYLANTPRRRCRKLAGALVCVLLAWLPGSIVFAADDLFQQGFEAYAAGGYERAASLFGESARPPAAPGPL